MDSEVPSLRVIEAVAREAGESPETLSPPLYETIDPDALDEIVARSSTAVRVTFEYHGYEVQVDGTGSVSVAAPDTVETEAPST